jgi:hypothetical protein
LNPDGVDQTSIGGVMKEITVAVIGGLFSIATSVVGAEWFVPGLVRLDIFFPTKNPEILDDFVFVHFQVYQEREGNAPIEQYTNPYTNQTEGVFDKGTYVEHVWLRKTNSPYTLSLTTTGAAPEIITVNQHPVFVTVNT